MDLNSVSLTARLTRDPEGRTTPSGTSVCRMRIAVNGFTGNATGRLPGPRPARPGSDQRARAPGPEGPRARAELD